MTTGGVELSPERVAEARKAVEEAAQHADTLAKRIDAQAQEMVGSTWKSHNASQFGQTVEEHIGEINQANQMLQALNELVHSAGDQITAQSGG